MYEADVLMLVLINVGANKDLYLVLDFSSCDFLNQGTPIIQLLVFFINFQPDQWPETFVKVLI